MPPDPNPELHPALPAYRLRRPGGIDGLLVWCAWCQDAHRHGAGGGYGGRVADCYSGAGSPFAGYQLTPAGEVDRAADVRPKAPLAGADFAGRLARANLGERLLKALLKSRLGLGVITVPGATVSISGAHWTMRPAAAPPIAGHGLLDLCARLFGVPPGVAAVRVLEAVMRIKLDARAALEIAAAVDRWAGRGKRADGRS